LDNIVLFNLMRPPDSTSWLFGAPPLAGKLAGALFVALYLAAAIRVWRRPPTSSERCGLASFLILASILLGPVAHHNYQLWWLPLFAALLGAALAMAPRRAAAS
jgi:glycerol uptake facilitator-like aquaporin